MLSVVHLQNSNFLNCYIPFFFLSRFNSIVLLHYRRKWRLFLQTPETLTQIRNAKIPIMLRGSNSDQRELPIFHISLRKYLPFARTNLINSRSPMLLCVNKDPIKKLKMSQMYIPAPNINLINIRTLCLLLNKHVANRQKMLLKRFLYINVNPISNRHLIL